jgi:hypothetical protein
MGAVSSRPRVVTVSAVFAVFLAVVSWALRAKNKKIVDDPMLAIAVDVHGRNDDEELTGGEKTRGMNNDKGKAEMLACKELLFGPTLNHGMIDLTKLETFPRSFLQKDVRGYKNNKGQVLQFLTRPAIRQIFGYSARHSGPLLECYRSIFEADGPVVSRAREDPADSGVHDELLANAIEYLGRSIARRHQQRDATIKKGRLECADWRSCPHNHCKMLRTLVECERQLEEELASREQQACVAGVEARPEQQRREVERQEDVPEPKPDVWGAGFEPQPEPEIVGGDGEQEVKDTWDSSEEEGGEST